MEFPDRRTALTAAFTSRFNRSVTALPWPPLIAGAVVGLLISIPDAIATKAYTPILVTGLILGALVCWAAGRWAH